MTSRISALIEIGFFVSKYKYLCKCISTELKTKVVWHETKVVNILDHVMLKEMKQDEKNIIKIINNVKDEHPDWTCFLTSEKIQQLEKKHDCISK